MLFNFSRFNHCRQGRIIVEDITRIMGAQIEALGHEVSHSEGPFVGGALGYNVVLEAFEDPAHVAAIADAHADGCRFIIVATEEPTLDGFNHGLEPAMIARQNVFPAAAAYADAILHLVPGEHVTAWYSRHAPAAAAELGHAPGLVAPDDVEPDHDFGFYGKMTWRRGQMLNRLAELSGKPVLRIDSLDVPWRERDATMRRAKVIVQIRANDEWGMVSSTRCASALSFGRPIVAEPHPYSRPWDDVVAFSESVEAFYRDAVAATRAWRELHAAQLARFEARLTPEFCVGAPLRAVGILP